MVKHPARHAIRAHTAFKFLYFLNLFFNLYALYNQITDSYDCYSNLVSMTVYDKSQKHWIHGWHTKKL